MSMLFDTTPTYYSRHLAPPLFMSPFMEAGTAPFPTTPTTAADSKSAAALGFTFCARHPTPAELRAHLQEAYGGEAGAGEGAETFLRAIPDAQLRHHLAEVGDLEAVMRGVSLTNRATPRGASFTAQGPGCTLRAEGDTYVFEAQTPGVRKQDLYLEVVGRRLQLTISEHDPHMERMRFNDQELALQQAAIDAASSSSPAATSGVASTDPSPPTAEELHSIEVEAPPAPPSPAPREGRRSPDHHAPPRRRRVERGRVVRPGHPPRLHRPHRRHPRGPRRRGRGGQGCQEQGERAQAGATHRRGGGRRGRGRPPQGSRGRAAHRGDTPHSHCHLRLGTGTWEGIQVGFIPVVQ